MVRNSNNAQKRATNLLTSSTGNSPAVFFLLLFVVVAAGLFYHLKICVRNTTGSWKGHIKNKQTVSKTVSQFKIIAGSKLMLTLIYRSIEFSVSHVKGSPTITFSESSRHLIKEL